MTLEIGPALKYGWGRLTTPVGRTLVGIATAYQLVVSVVYVSMLAAIAPGDTSVALNLYIVPFTIPMSPVVLFGLFILVLLAGSWLWVVLLRGLATEQTDDLPREVYTRRVSLAAVTMVAAGILAALLAMVGFVLLVIPGLIIAISLSFTPIFVAVDDDGPVEALKHSWGMAKGNRVELFVLWLAIGILAQAAGIAAVIVGTILSFLIPVVGWLVSTVVFGAVNVFQFAVLVGAYRQLREEDGGKYGTVSEPDPEAGPSESTSA